MHFTVITPTHQRRELLPEAVASVSAPLAFSFEHLIYDNGSHDGTAAYFWAFARPMSAPLPPPADAEVYNIPAAHRKMENLHIVFWLLKDLAWCMVWRPLGLLMVVPTLGIALVIAWRTRAYPSELAHNLAIVCWITANSYWMSSEFFGFDAVQVAPHITGKHLALVPFLIGLGILLYYYLVQKPRETQAESATL